MKTAGIAIDRWKLDIFTRHLVGAGYQFTEDPFTDKTLFLKVQTEDIDALSKVVKAANDEAAEVKDKPCPQCGVRPSEPAGEYQAHCGQCGKGT